MTLAPVITPLHYNYGECNGECTLPNGIRLMHRLLMKCTYKLNSIKHIFHTHSVHLTVNMIWELHVCIQC